MGVRNSADVKCDSVKKVLFIIPLWFLIVLFAVLGAFNSITYSLELGENFFTLNKGKKEPNYKLPPTWHIQYNSTTKDYILCCIDNDFDFRTYLELYKGAGPFINGVWKFSDIEDAARFKDTSELKYYAHLLYNIKVKENNKNKFMTLTK